MRQAYTGYRETSQANHGSCRLAGYLSRTKPVKGSAGAQKYSYLLAGKKIRYPNQVWATDLTYIKLPSGHVYLMAIIDLYSRRVLNWIITNTLDAPIFASCLQETNEQNGCPAIFNTDQGCQFTSDCWTSVLHEYGISISMDGKNRALENIYVERLWRLAFLSRSRKATSIFSCFFILHPLPVYSHSLILIPPKPTFSP